MFVRIQILKDDGETVLHEVLGHACSNLSEYFAPGHYISENGQTLHGFSYKQAPPPELKDAVAEFFR